MATSERDELRAVLDAREVEYDGRAGVAKLRQLVAETAHLANEADDGGETDDGGDDEPLEPDVVPEPEPTPPASVWPKRISPTTWLNEDGSVTRA